MSFFFYTDQYVKTCDRRSGGWNHAAKRKMQRDHGAFFGFPRDVCGAIVHLHDPGNDRKTDTGALKLCGGVQSGKDREQFVGVFGIKTRAVIFDLKRKRGGVRFSGNVDLCDLAVSCELDGIA